MLIATYLIGVEGWWSSSSPVLDSRLEPHEEVYVPIIFLIAKVHIVLHVNAAGHSRPYKKFGSKILVQKNLVKYLVTTGQL